MKYILRPTMLSIFWLQGHHSLKDSPTWESVLIAHCNLHTNFQFAKLKGPVERLLIASDCWCSFSGVATGSCLESVAQ